jgi:hypothetical protein
MAIHSGRLDGAPGILEEAPCVPLYDGEIKSFKSVWLSLVGFAWVPTRSRH